MGNKVAVIATTVAMSAGLAENSQDDAALAALLNDLGGNESEQNDQAKDTTTVVGEADIEQALATIPSETSTPAAEQPAPGEPVVEPAVAAPAPVTTTETPAPATEKKAKGKNKGFKKDGSKPAETPKTDEQKQAEKLAADAAKQKAKDEREAKRAADKAKREAEKSAKPKTTFYGNDKVRRIKETMGEKLGELLVLELGDAALEGEALVAKQNEVLTMIGQQAVKVKNRIVLLLDFVAGKQKELSHHMQLAFEVLARDGKLVAGDKGNLHAAFLAKPYSPGASRSMGRNTINTFAAMKILVKGEKGEFTPNPNSMMLAKVNGLIGLTK